MCRRARRALEVFDKRCVVEKFTAECWLDGGKHVLAIECSMPESVMLWAVDTMSRDKKDVKNIELDDAGDFAAAELSRKKLVDILLEKSRDNDVVLFNDGVQFIMKAGESLESLLVEHDMDAEGLRDEQREEEAS